MSSLFVPPTIYIEPSIITDEYGQHTLNVPQHSLYYYHLPPENAPEYQHYFKCNAFLMYRRTLQKALNTRTNVSSKMAKESWDYAPEQFKKFFKDYTKAVLSYRRKFYKILVKKDQKKQQNKFKSFIVDQEEITKQHFRIETINFKFV
ncbi:hypothetical protein C1645_823604 [Glomus cerebriforme]|uniref:Uncharacterized protein n=1 Tax=Glomus cerebriforme TaxID=658196 RepID=A0A397T219_9GLOM|nr:hypothetical protein C1645_823604 [Glomus cerebriforme]